MNFRYRLMQFMSGRYGVDGLFYALFAVSAILAIVNCFLRVVWLQFVVYAIIIYAFFRIVSRNIQARRRENRAFINLGAKVFKKYNVYRQRKMDRGHVYKKCPACRAVLRLPRRKGKHTTICPKCNKEFRVYVFKA